MVICEKNNKIIEYDDKFLKANTKIIIASYFKSEDIEYLKKLGITPIIFNGSIEEAINTFSNLDINHSKPALRNKNRGIGCGRGYSNGKGFMSK